MKFDHRHNSKIATLPTQNIDVSLDRLSSSSRDFIVNSRSCLFLIKRCQEFGSNSRVLVRHLASLLSDERLFMFCLSRQTSVTGSVTFFKWKSSRFLMISYLNILNKIHFTRQSIPDPKGQHQSDSGKSRKSYNVMSSHRMSNRETFCLWVVDAESKYIREIVTISFGDHSHLSHLFSHLFRSLTSSRYVIRMNLFAQLHN